MLKKLITYLNLRIFLIFHIRSLTSLDLDLTEMTWGREPWHENSNFFNSLGTQVKASYKYDSDLEAPPPRPPQSNPIQTARSPCRSQASRAQSPEPAARWAPRPSSPPHASLLAIARPRLVPVCDFSDGWFGLDLVGPGAPRDGAEGDQWQQRRAHLHPPAADPLAPPLLQVLPGESAISTLDLYLTRREVCSRVADPDYWCQIAVWSRLTCGSSSLVGRASSARTS